MQNVIVSGLNSWLKTIDESLITLSHGKEGKTSLLPSWVLSKREINIGFIGSMDGIVFRVVPRTDIDSDIINISILHSTSDANIILEPFELENDVINLRNTPFMTVADTRIFETNNPLAKPNFQDNALWGYGQVDGALSMFTESDAKIQAIDFWNKAISGVDRSKNFIIEANLVFSRLKSLLKHKSFLERKIHRFIYEHAALILPDHCQCYFEHIVHYKTGIRKTDFILKRDEPFSPLLIELESPHHKIIGKNDDLLAPVSHAIQQITEWISFIDRETETNVKGEFEFLSGPKERLVVIGTGFQHKERLKQTKFSDTKIITYNMLIESAVQNWNRKLNEQHRLLGLGQITAFNL